MLLLLGIEKKIPFEKIKIYVSNGTIFSTEDFIIAVFCCRKLLAQSVALWLRHFIQLSLLSTTYLRSILKLHTAYINSGDRILRFYSNPRSFMKIFF